MTRRQRLEGHRQKPTDGWGYQELDKARRILPWRPQTALAPPVPQFQTSSFQASGRTHFCSLKGTTLYYFLTAALQPNSAALRGVSATCDQRCCLRVWSEKVFLDFFKKLKPFCIQVSCTTKKQLFPQTLISRLHTQPQSLTFAVIWLSPEKWYKWNEMYANSTRDGIDHPACTLDSSFKMQQLVLVNFRQSLAPTELRTLGDHKVSFCFFFN